MTDTANAPEREAGTPGPHEPDYKTAMLYHSDRADAYMGERDALTAELAKLRADLAEAQVKIVRLTEALAIAGPIALKDFDSHPFILNAEEQREVEVILAALQENANG